MKLRSRSSARRTLWVMALKLRARRPNSSSRSISIGSGKRSWAIASVAASRRPSGRSSWRRSKQCQQHTEEDVGGESGGARAQVLASGRGELARVERDLQTGGRGQRDGGAHPARFPGGEAAAALQHHGVAAQDTETALLFGQYRKTFGDGDGHAAAEVERAARPAPRSDRGRRSGRAAGPSGSSRSRARPARWPQRWRGRPGRSGVVHGTPRRYPPGSVRMASGASLLRSRNT